MTDIAVCFHPVWAIQFEKPAQCTIRASFRAMRKSEGADFRKQHIKTRSHQSAGKKSAEILERPVVNSGLSCCKVNA